MPLWSLLTVVNKALQLLAISRKHRNLKGGGFTFGGGKDTCKPRWSRRGLDGQNGEVLWLLCFWKLKLVFIMWVLCCGCSCGQRIYLQAADVNMTDNISYQEMQQTNYLVATWEIPGAHMQPAWLHLRSHVIDESYRLSGSCWTHHLVLWQVAFGKFKMLPIFIQSYSVSSVYTLELHALAFSPVR